MTATSRIPMIIRLHTKVHTNHLIESSKSIIRTIQIGSKTPDHFLINFTRFGNHYQSIDQVPPTNWAIEIEEECMKQSV